MMPQHLRVFLSSPGDVAGERAIALEIIEQLDNSLDEITMEAIAWDKPGGSAPMLATMTPQQAINEGLLKPSECDIVVVIFWSRMGTPLPEEYKKSDGTRFMSGTEWEFHDAMQSARRFGRPEVLVYRRTEEILLSPGQPDFMDRYEQWQRVETFFKQFVHDDGSIRTGFNRYTRPDEFGTQFRHHLETLARRMVKLPPITPEADDDSAEPPELRLLRQAVRVWEDNDRADDFLWMGRQLDDARTVASRLQPALNSSERAFLKPEHERLLDDIHNPATTHYRRVRIGDRLNELGDTRPGVGLDNNGVPDIAWCAIPEGEITLTDNRRDVSAARFKVAPFAMAKYQVTYAQYMAFIEADDGWYDERWWMAIGTHRDAPSQPRKFDNHPVENVSWYDATAFCRWLSHHLGYEIRLPTEWEWQWAAGGTHPYPWGDSWQHHYVNCRESDLLRTTAVGMYPLGASPYGVLDIVGNVWEWCQNELDNPAVVAFKSRKQRSLRGCSCLSRSHKAVIAYRAGNSPGKRNEAHGFRVVTSNLEVLK
ncbi:MAG: formylglycine-generating enzyme family protein [Chloroflexi bacterium]|nr:formylglycine-generating enzyme family protein [Chloroflexota bacterium]